MQVLDLHPSLWFGTSYHYNVSFWLVPTVSYWLLMLLLATLQSVLLPSLAIQSSKATAARLAEVHWIIRGLGISSTNVTNFSTTSGDKSCRDLQQSRAPFLGAMIFVCFWRCLLVWKVKTPCFRAAFARLVVSFDWVWGSLGARCAVVYVCPTQQLVKTSGTQYFLNQQTVTDLSTAAPWRV